jgi:hypothetical protein
VIEEQRTTLLSKLREINESREKVGSYEAGDPTSLDLLRYQVDLEEVKAVRE